MTKTGKRKAALNRIVNSSLSAVVQSNIGCKTPAMFFNWLKRQTAFPNELIKNIEIISPITKSSAFVKFKSSDILQLFIGNKFTITDDDNGKIWEIMIKPYRKSSHTVFAIKTWATLDKKQWHELLKENYGGNAQVEVRKCLTAFGESSNKVGNSFYILHFINESSPPHKKCFVNKDEDPQQQPLTPETEGICLCCEKEGHSAVNCSLTEVLYSPPISAYRGMDIHIKIDQEDVSNSGKVKTEEPSSDDTTLVLD